MAPTGYVVIRYFVADCFTILNYKLRNGAMHSKLETDRYGVSPTTLARLASLRRTPTEQFDTERARDLWHGRAGQDGFQAATPVHVRAGLADAALETRTQEKRKRNSNFQMAWTCF